MCPDTPLRPVKIGDRSSNTDFLSSLVVIVGSNDGTEGVSAWNRVSVVSGVVDGLCELVVFEVVEVWNDPIFVADLLSG